ncbi:right-handed parallel beta-helix repeat-containing protein [Marseilla massiliensis]|uniref:Right-handed parallel beta-helix repeat-containing protein n=1 Tax=Marseilla massiliensis TaxID=1841864 RepID=A0A938WUI7_9BACT|nr:right-handed parallel beta-helix repeat-containing protein [Marseilla massiliensis]MBM6673414.1 right-handed parallel beta-helix repeat-containing protein [Marseilla massiliensis]
MDTRKTLITSIFAVTIGLTSYATDLLVKPGAYSIEKALQQAREERRLNNATDICLRLQEGVYQLNQPITIRPEDNGTRIVADGKVTISGGVSISGWKKEGKCYVADVPDFNGRPLEFRQLWVNGKKAVRARDVNDFEQMFRIRSVDKANETIYVPAKAVKKIINAKYPEMVLHEMWCIANLRIKNIKIQGDSAAVTFHQPESHVHFMHPWPSPMVTTDGHNSAFYLTNAKELLDSEGEWYLDARASKLYYIPRKGEDMGSAEVIAPAVETLVQVAGTPDEPVKDVTFEGITFSYATWMRPSVSGHAPLQAGMYMTEAYKLRPKMDRPNGDHKLDNQGWVGRPPAAVSLNCAENVSFTKCTFEHNASTGLDYHLYIKGGTVDHCTFRDIGGNGILAGGFSPEGFEAHKPYDPADRRIICTGLNITNNLITDVTNEDWGCVGIGAGFVRDIRICNNEISDVSYTGISVGWGWNQQPCSMANNLISGNLIYNYAKHMYDTAGIYTLGAQPHSLIEGNVVRDIYTPSYVHDPEHWFYLYTDEGSSGITVRNNWTPAEKYLKNANGPGNTWENNGPAVADSIKANAGIRK